MERKEREKRNLAIVELRTAGKSMQEIAETLGVAKHVVSYVCQKNNLGGKRSERKAKPSSKPHQKKTDESVKEQIESAWPHLEYVGGYAGIDRPVTVRCKKCGETYSKSMVSLRHTNRTVICPGCAKKQKEEKEKQKQKQKQKQKDEVARTSLLNKLDKSRQVQMIQCAECAEMFLTIRSDRKFCSSKCAKKAANRLASNHKDKRIKPEKRRASNITARRLYVRDSGICWLCGELCDLSDYEVRENGVIVCGGAYPSVDHVIPIAKGGEHSWKNVKLAHRECNIRKRDKIISWGMEYKQVAHG